MGFIEKRSGSYRARYRDPLPHRLRQGCLMLREPAGEGALPRPGDRQGRAQLLFAGVGGARSGQPRVAGGAADDPSIRLLAEIRRELFSPVPIHDKEVTEEAVIPAA